MSDADIIHIGAYRTEMHRALATILYIDTINFNLSRYPTFMCKYKYYKPAAAAAAVAATVAS